MQAEEDAVFVGARVDAGLVGARVDAGLRAARFSSPPSSEEFAASIEPKNVPAEKVGPDVAVEAMMSNENNCSEGTCTTNPDCRRMPNAHENSRSENDSLPSTSKEPELKYWRTNVGQKQQISGGPIEGGVNSSTTERSHNFERDATAPMVSDKHGSDTRRAANLSGPLSLPTRASANSYSARIRSSGGTMP